MRLHDNPKLTGKYLDRVLASGWYTTGLWNERLKVKVAEETGWSADRIVLASSATAAFQAIIDLLSMAVPRPRVYITESTWPGLHHIVDNLCRRDSSEKAVVTVTTDIGGRNWIDPPDTHKYTKEYIHVHDACHSWWPSPAALFSFASFYPTKLAPGAEGGVIFCRHWNHVETLERLLYCGLRPGHAGGELPSYPGRKANMPDTQAALNLEAMELFSSNVRRIHDQWHQLAEYAKNLDVPYRDQPIRPYLFQVEVPQGRVVSFRKKLLYLGVPTAQNFPPSPLVTVPLHLSASLFSELAHVYKNL